MDRNFNNMLLNVKKVVRDESSDTSEEDMGEESYQTESGMSNSKKTKLNGGGSGRLVGACCVVENCEADMADYKNYYRRHRVCEGHAKAPVVRIDGIRQRFCQQCSRFHVLSEFDDMKRSCRKRLAGHNERRRKNSLDSPGEGSTYKGSDGHQFKQPDIIS